MSMDRKRVLDGLRCHASSDAKCHLECPYHGCGTADAVCSELLAKDALALLKEQEPITPCIRGEEGFSHNDFTRQYGCGSCGKPIDHGDEFCRHCGKAVAWDA